MFRIPEHNSDTYLKSYAITCYTLTDLSKRKSWNRARIVGGKWTPDLAHCPLKVFSMSATDELDY